MLHLNSKSVIRVKQMSDKWVFCGTCIIAVEDLLLWENVVQVMLLAWDRKNLGPPQYSNSDIRDYRFGALF